VIAAAVFRVLSKPFQRDVVGLFPSFLLEKGRGQAGTVVGIERIEPHRLARRFFGLLVTVAVLQHQRATVVRVGPSRRDADRLFHLALSFVQLVLMHEAHAEQSVGARIVRVEGKCASQLLLG
jgi:hypothetical protein